MKEDKSWLPHSSHWGAFFAKWENKQLHVKPHPINQNPNQLINNFPNSIRHRARVGKPMVRKGWLENGPGPSSKRGTDEYVPVSWDKAINLVTKELKRVQSTYGAEAIFGGSYGWSSAGRFHHAQSQVHRFLNIAMGGYVRSLTNYSCGAALILFPYILGDNVDNLMLQSISWQQIIDHTDIVLAFGGLPLKNSIVSPGGASNHLEPSVIKTAAERGCQFYSITPLKSDLTDSIHFDWLGVAPGTDTALMLAMMH